MHHLLKQDEINSNNNPTIWGWFISPIHGDFLGWFAIGFTTLVAQLAVASVELVAGSEADGCA